ncbi:MAG: AcrR family transcriptional regulator [Thermoproteota archaeon]|jgi:AcrR family transcriptional regulator
MDSRAQQKLKTRRNLIDTALALSYTKGFANLSLREVMSAAGLSPAAFYRHFDNMEELGLSLLDEVGMSLRNLLRSSRKISSTNKSLTSLSIDTFIKYVNENANHFKLLLGERQGASKSFRNAIHSEICMFVSELTEDLERISLSRNEKLRNASFAAEAIVAVVFTVGAEALDLPKHKQAGLAARIVEEVNMILRGARV